MPLLLIPLLLVLLLLLWPIGLWFRFRTGKTLRPLYGWVMRVNVALTGFSTLLYLFGAWVAQRWLPMALADAGLGLMAGAVLGLIGLWLSKFVEGPSAILYAPNRWLVLAIALAVMARAGVALYNGWLHVRALGGDGAGQWHDTSLALLATAGVLLGYALTTSLALRWRHSRWKRRWR